MTDDSDKLNIHLPRERELSRLDWRNSTAEKMVEMMEQLEAIVSHQGHSGLKYKIEEVKKLAECTARQRSEVYGGAYVNELDNTLKSAIGNFLRLITDLHNDILTMAAALDRRDIRIGTIEQQREDLSPQELLRIELAEVSEDERRKQRAEGWQEQQAAKESVQCQCDKRSGDAWAKHVPRCDKPAKILFDGRRMCGVHARQAVKRLTPYSGAPSDEQQTQIDAIEAALTRSKKSREIEPVQLVD